MHLADQKGQIIILKRNKPKYMLINLDESPIIEMTDDEKIDFVLPVNYIELSQMVRALIKLFNLPCIQF